MCKASGLLALLAAGVLLPVNARSALDITTVQGAGGVPLTMAQTGNRDGRQLLFVHGYSQSYLSWEKQLDDPELRRRFHMVAFDIRGHGASAKPHDPAAYSSTVWADDLQAVIMASGNRRPVLIAWSMGGPIAMSYVSRRGTQHIAGIVLVASPALFSPPIAYPSNDAREMRQRQAAAQMLNEDLSVNYTGTQIFVRMLTARPLPAAVTQAMVAYNMMTPAYVRRALVAGYSGWSQFDGVQQRLNIPVLIVHGTADDLLPYQNSVQTRQAIPLAQFSAYPGIGHAPFFEEAPRFNRELMQFAPAGSDRL